MNFFDKKIIDKIRSQSANAEESKQIPKEWLKFIYEKKWFKLFVPKHEGGLMMPLPQALRLFDEAAYIDGNLGWAITIGSGGGYFYAFMQPDIATKVYKGSKAVIAGGGKPAQIVKQVKGGYTVTGRWQFSSGASYASSFTLNAQVDKNKVLAFIVEPKQLIIHKDWDAIGMRASESHSVSATNTFVPYNMTFDLTNAKLFYKDSFYQYPFLQFAEASFAALSLGLCRHFFEEVNIQLKENRKNWSAVKGRYEFVQKLVASKEADFQKASTQFYEVADESWQELLKHGKLNDKTQNEVSKLSKGASRVVLNSMDAIIQYMGMNAVMQGSVINRIWRDAHTACQHVLLVPFGKV